MRFRDSLDLIKRKLIFIDVFLRKRILNKPITKCKNWFCTFCLIQHLNGRRRNRCPKCHKDCNREQTVPPISQYLNLLNNLRIKFNCVENGCHEVVRLGSLSSYSEECIHKICVSCRLKTSPNVEYNCSELLKRELIKSRKEYENYRNLI